MACAQLRRVLEALEHRDVALARDVVAGDDAIDELYRELHERIIALLALQAPVAGDLRLAAALLHVIRSVERMGDQCVNIAKLIPLDGHHPPTHPVLLEELGVMGRLVGHEIAQAKRAFAERDMQLARDLVHQDRDVNELNRASSSSRGRAARTPTAASGRCTWCWRPAPSSGWATSPSTSASSSASC